MQKETKRWQHSLVLNLFEKAQVLIVSLDGIHLAIDNSETTRRFFSGSNMKKKTADKIREIIESEFVQLPENPTTHYGKIYIRKSTLWELIPVKKMIETSEPIETLFDEDWIEEERRVISELNKE